MSSIKGVKPEKGTGDKALYFDRCRVFWITCKGGAAAPTFQLNDSGNDSGADVWDIIVPISTPFHCVFDPPMLFEYGLYVDVKQTDASWTIGALPGHGENDQYLEPKP